MPGKEALERFPSALNLYRFSRHEQPTAPPLYEVRYGYWIFPIHNQYGEAEFP
ncbi:hypothetical protein JMJ77_0009563 [Colletotrichum scovillei]|uniref:Uncharacterized protein n=1 Tax=Colletotrichum scovillei TaxID=1209932 RepID=A0A9P7R0S1_9PEZI|nr:hypothetical protein JMJ77_0009563 [Colletotrichum scovillei]KAG7052642.1 hypothetical protein JMJ78_0005657 [Colletotrichum scovillei]KAG7064935.1 hypothetical protein JMJ76_0012691 [Colletotrichum scovillei]